MLQSCLQAAIKDKGAVSLCRCFRSNKFPLCDGCGRLCHLSILDCAGCYIALMY